MKHRKTLEQLYKGYVQGLLSAEELADFVQQVQDATDDAHFNQLVEGTFSEANTPTDDMEGLQAFQRFRIRIQAEPGHLPAVNKATRAIPSIWKYAAIAATVLLCIYVGRQYLSPSSETPTLAYQRIQDIKPGGTVAYLESNTGIQTPLSDGGQLHVRDSYLEDGDGHILPQQKVDEEWLHLVVPKGGTYNITLSDGSRVFINSESRLSFPKHFTASNRIIKLSGEAFFEVSHDAKKPFIVDTDLQKVRVLGTSFNVSAYPKERTVTTLISGKVNITTAKENLDLRPGMQGITIANDIQLLQADLESALAWKNNKFVFLKTPLPEIIKQLERWYNVSIHIQQGSESLYNKTFSGSIAKDASFEELLKLFKTTESIKVEVREGRVYLMK